MKSTLTHRHLIPVLLVIALLSSFSGCQSALTAIREVSSEAGRLGVLRLRQSAFIGNAAYTFRTISRDITPEQEYYIGRSVGARVLERYRVYEMPELTLYLNRLGQGLAQFSERPEIYRGYRFLVLDSLEINAFATPGGHIFVTRGLLACARSEDELAAMLAHEIAHVARRHGVNSIRSARFGEAVAKLALEAGKMQGGEIARFAEVFGDSIQDITMTLVNSGYSQVTEFDADIAARSTLEAAGYDPGALASMLATMKSVLGSSERGFGATHPRPELRIANLGKAKSVPASPEEAGRVAPPVGIGFAGPDAEARLARMKAVREARFRIMVRLL